MADGERVAIVGSRGYPDRIAVEAYVWTLSPGSVVVTGGAPGPDTWAAEEIEQRSIEGLSVEVYPADWETHGRAAGPVRNTTIVERCDRVVAFWDGQSKGTLDTIRKAVRAGKPVEIVPPRREP